MVDLSHYNLTKNQHRILFIIFALEDVSIKKILLLLGISKQAANVALRDLLSRDLVTEERSKEDKRIKYLQLTPAGRALSDQISVEQQTILNKYFDAADGDWQQAMTKLAEKYLNRVN
ncbi:MarR family winged helix-turn-helix transcriptional regulator [Fructobacillus pseudoficulneus]|nr:MarR family transcriptional regulator [Fructobacillus pseudoficulneus]